eukprot:CAMPEP_0182441564 /NCGR_PEP_ID=MMETSP1172-20130603/537_1 /TAXON_ID=708627 /ORGANISM="Timspurckia oligopyrenoides, Strain CCMP3278" /LENGTH=375 /DNA_ID=CAMNT_0024635925 /DNA_START=44 /DNA_END=1171 /DNA_ORIENTATION=+
MSVICLSRNLKGYGNLIRVSLDFSRSPSTIPSLHRNRESSLFSCSIRSRHFCSYVSTGSDKSANDGTTTVELDDDLKSISALEQLPKDVYDRYVLKKLQWRKNLKKPVYTMPFLECTAEEIEQLDYDTSRKALKAYGGATHIKLLGFIKRFNNYAVKHNVELFREQRKLLPKLIRDRLTRMVRIPNKQVLKHGVVVSNKMNKTVVVVGTQRKFNEKLRKEYFRSVRFKAHDEFDLCREGDEVVIKECRKLGKHVAHVVIENYGSRETIGEDNRQEILDEKWKALNPKETSKVIAELVKDEYYEELHNNRALDLISSLKMKASVTENALKRKENEARRAARRAEKDRAKSIPDSSEDHDNQADASEPPNPSEPKPE